MKFIDTVKRSGRNLSQAKMRTLLTALAIAVGGFTLTLTLSAAAGARQYADRIIQANIDPNSVIVAKDKNMFNEGTVKPQEYSNDLAAIYGTLLKQLSQEDVANIKELPHVASVIEDFNMTAQFITREGAKKYTGTLQVYNPAQKPEMKAGKAPESLPPGSVLLPEEYLPLLRFKSAEDAIGETITIQIRQLGGATQARQYKVSGVTMQPALSLSFLPVGPYLAQEDARQAHNFINGETVLAGKVPTVTVRTDGHASAEKVKQSIIDAGYEARTAKDAQKLLNQIITVLQSIVLVFGLIALIASFFGVVNTQYISVLERTREIGLMKALGMSRGGVSRLFIVEATWIGFIGALLGSLVAIAVGTALNPLISDKLNFGDERLLIFTVPQIAGLIIFLMLVTTLAGLLPAHKAARLDPVEALRSE
ncbi:MAG TPA: ABC transporter permease [Candidatus Saccharimonadales bacterium]|nr:ABC transporter permease [Candidatus Saccharimonadales bacterium]